MARYIDADKATPYFYEHLSDNGMAGAQNALNEMPTEDVAPVRHGHWLQREINTRGEFQAWCSRCGMPTIWNGLDRNYCSFCGAKMDEEVKL